MMFLELISAITEDVMWKTVQKGSLLFKMSDTPNAHTSEMHGIWTWVDNGLADWQKPDPLTFDPTLNSCSLHPILS